ncbi:MAG: DUF1489 family protein [Rhizobiaceae bacterium]
MPLHLLKLCVGAATVEEQAQWIEQRQAQRRSDGKPAESIHTTRMIPKRAEELLDGGSLYWVIKGNVQARQRLLDIRPFVDGDGIARCDLVMEPKLVLTAWQPRRAFQGWRYLKSADAPLDLGGGEGVAALPPQLRSELAQLGLL